ncbi:hypothetical protein E7Z54_15115, partial [Nocardioides sp.]
MSTATGTCTQPGCTGSIVDGYCDVCGMPGEGGHSTHAAGGGAAVSAPAPSVPVGRVMPSNGDPCEQPGCAGRILDGYCDVCGTPAVPRARVAEASALASA